MPTSIPDGIWYQSGQHRPLPLLWFSGVVLMANLFVLDFGKVLRCLPCWLCWALVLGIHQVNFHSGGTWVPLMAPPDYGHPGQYGAAFYYERLQWQNTVEATKPLPGAAPFWPVPGYSLLDAAGADVGFFGHPLNLSFVDHLPIHWMFSRPTVLVTRIKRVKTFLNCFVNCFNCFGNCLNCFGNCFIFLKIV